MDAGERCLTMLSLASFDGGKPRGFLAGNNALQLFSMWVLTDGAAVNSALQCGHMYFPSTVRLYKLVSAGTVTAFFFGTTFLFV